MFESEDSTTWTITEDNFKKVLDALQKELPDKMHEHAKTLIKEEPS